MSRILRGCATLLLAGVVAAAVGCKENKPSDMSKSGGGASLYDRIGGHEAVVKVVDGFVAKAAADPKVNFTRTNPMHPNHWDPSADDNMARLKKHLVQFIEMAAGGPQKYEGRSMEEVHKGMEITEAEFSAAAEDLKQVLMDAGVPQREQDDLMAAVGGTKGSIVGK